MTSRDAMRHALAERLVDCSADELRVIGAIVARLELGRRQYGPLDLSADGRDWVKERREELLDTVIYTVFAELKAAS